MHLRFVALILLCLGAGGGAAFSQEQPGLFPEGPAALTPERSISFASGSKGKVSVTSYRFKPKAGLTHWFMAQWCGITVETGQTTSKPILVIGIAQTDTLTCLGLKDAGPMPPYGRQMRIGLVYRTASPNFQGTTPVLLMFDPMTKDWRIDHSHDDEFGRVQPMPTIAAMRGILLASHD